jgi:hypothetical protein
MPKKSILKTNFRIVIVKVNSTDDGHGLAKDQAEALNLFGLVMAKVSNFKDAKLYFENKLIKRLTS